MPIGRFLLAWCFVGVHLCALSSDLHFTYSVNGDGESVTVTGLEEGNVQRLVIPSTIDSFKVTKIADGAFQSRSEISHVEIPSSVTQIGAHAFSGDSGIRSVVVPTVAYLANDFRDAYENIVHAELASGSTYVNDKTFSYCQSLETIVLPDTVKSIYGYAFYNCISLQSLNIPAGVSSIGHHAFGGCSNLVCVTVAMENEWFKAENGLLLSKDGRTLICCLGGVVNAVMPDGVTSVAEGAFSGPNRLESITWSDSVVEIGPNAFERCSVLKSLEIPEHVTVVPRYAFESCSQLEHVVFRGDVSVIDDGAFESCVSLSDMLFPASVKTIGVYAFAWCSSLSSLTFKGKIDQIGRSAFLECHSLSAINGLNEDVILESRVFKGCDGLAKNGLTIVNNCVWWCSGNIDEIVVPEGVIRLGEDAFARWDSRLERICLPSTLKSIGESCFDGCERLASISPLSEVVTIEDMAFRGCIGLSSNGLVIVNNRVYDYVGNGGPVVIPEGVTKICKNAFNCKTDITSVLCPSTLNSIADRSFSNNNKLSVIKFLGPMPQVGADVPFSFFAWEFCFVVAGDLDGWGDALRIGRWHGGFPIVAEPSSYSNVRIYQSGDVIKVYPRDLEDGPWSEFLAMHEGDVGLVMNAETGKRDADGVAILAWQDYVAGTDPTDETDVFTASITIVDGKVKVSCSPELDDARKALRKYTTWGKKSLMDRDWTEVQEGCEAEYNFFKVTVEMR